MERDEFGKTCDIGSSDDIDSRCAVNSLILDYYKKFGRKRDLEQFFSLSTAQSDIKDTSGLFWRKMKSENDSSDSGERKSDSSHEVCRISIKCSLPEHSSSQDDDTKTKTDSPHTESPPIIIEEVPADVSRHTDDDSINFDDNHSQKSFDVILDLSTHKPLSPTSSITSQRKLEWDSLADVGYANESERKTSASSLSTLERLALKQQYSNNDSKQDIGLPTSQSTPIDENEGKSKTKKGLGKKTTKVYKKDVDFVEVNVPHTSDTNQAPSINVNLTKHISFNVEKDGGITVDNIKRDVNISPEKICVEAPVSKPQVGMDKEIQTSLPREPSSSSSVPKEKSSSLNDPPKPVYADQKIPVMISLNTLRKRLRRNKSKKIIRKMRSKKNTESNKDVTPQEKSGEQLSEAESFEYMPGHMYNQNKLQDSEPRPDNSTAGNKSSLESSGPPTTDSSKGSKHSLTKDLEKCIDVLKVTLQQHYDDGSTKKKLIKNIVHRLVNSKYRDDDSTTEFLSGLNYNYEKFGIKDNNTTSSTSDANITENNKQKRPKKSILRTDKFNPNVVASTSQSAPNLFTASCEKVSTNVKKTHTSITESDTSSRDKSTSDNAFPKTSSEELYLKYLEALRREETYKRHLKDKEMFLKQKLVSYETAVKVPIRQEAKISSRLKDLMKDLTRNNYDDGSGDASKLEGGSSNMDFDRFSAVRNQRSHSVFTLSSSHSECQKRPNLKKKMQAEREIDEAGPSKEHYCCCPHHYTNAKVGYADSSVQVNIKYECEDSVCNDRASPRKSKPCVVSGDCKKFKECPKHTRVVPDSLTGEIKYICCCNGRPVSCTDVGDNIMIYKCSKLTTRGIQLDHPSRIYTTGVQCGSTSNSRKGEIEVIQSPIKLKAASESSDPDNISNARRYSKSSQTNMLMNLDYGNFDTFYSSGSETKFLSGKSTKILGPASSSKETLIINEATRCLQTEISINPKISDPNLSDISIINDTECAKLIAEHIRQVSKQNSNKSLNGKSNVSTSSESGKPIISSNNDLLKNDSIEKANVDYATPVAPISDNVLPIQATNMSIKMNLGAKKVPVQKEQVHTGVTTKSIDYSNEGTSLDEDCTKSVQCFCPVDQNSNKNCPKEPLQSPIKTSLTKKYLSPIILTYNTYPKNELVKEKPPLKRFNTDTDKLSVCTQVQTDPIAKKDALSNKQDKLISENQPVVKIVSDKTHKTENPIVEMPKVLSRFRFDESMTPKDYSVPPKSIQYSDVTNTLEHAPKGPELSEDKIDVGIQKDLSDEEPKSIKDQQCCKDCLSKSRTPKQNFGQCSADCPNFAQMPKNNNTKQCSKNCVWQIPKKNVGQCSEDCPNYAQTSENNVKQCSKDCPKTSQILRKNVGQCSEDCPNLEEMSKEKTEQCSKDSPNILQIPKRNAWSETDPLPNTPSGSCIGCQTVVPEAKVPEASKSPLNVMEKVQMEFCSEVCASIVDPSKDDIVGLIQDITRRYSKQDIIKIKKKKCFTEIVTVLNYLLDTEDSTETEPNSVDNKSSSKKEKKHKLPGGECCLEKGIDKSVQMSCGKNRIDTKECTESSELPCSTERPTTSSDSTACKVLKKIKKECEKFHLKRCKSGRKCEISSSTSVNCEKCKEMHYCSCRNHKCKRHKALEKLQKKCIAYNLIIQTSESMLSEETICDKKCRPLKNIVVKVPRRKDSVKVDGGCKKGRATPCCSPRKASNRNCGPRESESTDEFIRKVPQTTVREYLEQNRPDFVEKTSQRQNCMKFIRERRTQDSVTPRLKMVVLQQTPCMGNMAPAPVFCGGVCYKKCATVTNPCIPVGCKEVEPCISRCIDKVEPCIPCPVELCKSYNTCKPCDPCNSCNSCDTNFGNMRVDPCNMCSEFKRIAIERSTHRDLLSLHVEQQPDLTALTAEELRQLAQQIGLDLRRKRPAPKFMSEREMKKHSERIYKTLPEVVQKKEDKKKENIKKTNLLMANLFKKNLQTQALRGSVNLSNYHTVIKI